MRKIDKPSDRPLDVFRVCISRVRDPNLKHRLEQCENEIISAAVNFENNVLSANYILYQQWTMFLGKYLQMKW